MLSGNRLVWYGRYTHTYKVIVQIRGEWKFFLNFNPNEYLLLKDQKPKQSPSFCVRVTSNQWGSPWWAASRKKTISPMDLGIWKRACWEFVGGKMSILSRCNTIWICHYSKLSQLWFRNVPKGISISTLNPKYHFVCTCKRICCTGLIELNINYNYRLD